MGATAQRTMTVEEWADLDEEDRSELVDGVLEAPEMTGATHETVLAWLQSALRAYFHPRGGWVLGAGLKFALGARRGRIPDLSVFATKRPPPRGLIRFPADILIEVVSRGSTNHRRDRIAKVSDYARFGAKQYWLVDPEARTFEILELRDGTYAHVAGGDDGKLAVPGFDELVLDLDDLWGDLDRLGTDSEDE